MITIDENDDIVIQHVQRHVKTIEDIDTEDHYLQQKIDHEIKMRDGTAKLLAASKHPTQMLEAAKNLLTSNSRMIAYMSELQKRKTEEVLKKRQSLDGNQVPCKAKLCISDIRIPLMWKDTDHFKNKGDHRRYAVFCVWKVGTEICDTTLIKDVDRSMTDLTFDDVITFNEIPPDFECHLEVYSHKLHDDVTIASTPKKIKKKFHELGNSVGRSVGRRLSGLKDDPEFMANMLVGPKFDLVAHAVLKLKDVSDEIGIFDLVCDSNPSSDCSATELPLFGHYSCRLAAQPNCLVQDTTSGYLHIREGRTDWRQLWCVLRNLKLSCWEREEDVTQNEPVKVIPVTKETQISDADPCRSIRRHCFHITISSSSVSLRQDHTLAADSTEELTKWWDGFQQHMLDQAMWRHASDSLMDIPDSSSQKNLSFLRKGSLSLYDETPWKDSPQKTSTEKVRSCSVDETTAYTVPILSRLSFGSSSKKSKDKNHLHTRSSSLQTDI